MYFTHITLVFCPLIESNLYPYGEDVGDSEVQINSEDGNSPYVTPPISFPFMGKLFDRIFVSLRPLPFLLTKVYCCGTCHIHPPLPLCTSFQITDSSNFSLSARTSSTSCRRLSPTVSPATVMFLCWQHFGMMLTSPRGTGGCCIRLDRSDLNKEVV